MHFLYFLAMRYISWNTMGNLSSCITQHQSGMIRCQCKISDRRAVCQGVGTKYPTAEWYVKESKQNK